MKALSKETATKKIAQMAKGPKKGILKNKKGENIELDIQWDQLVILVDKMISGLRRRNIFRPSETPYERLQEEPEQRSPKEVETPFLIMKPRIISHLS